ncbi:acyltransferase family protein [Verrucomicrobium spinosum]|uniref:acyltransferase family protein n=1 Tax=Verrucomicrobium spinosum TaxID=2736 RepID=UPI0009464EDC|nr:acyltransferase [Verrucomicrobium spinosum]
MITSSSQRNLMLDVIRAFAVLIVLVHHIDGNLSVSGVEQASFAPYAPLFIPGWVGVPVFFVLSGFLIGSLLIQEHVRTGSVNIGRFLVRRGFKIYPPFYILLAGYILLMVAGGSRPEPERLMREILFLQNYGSGGLMDVTWSLAVEEHFYFLFAAWYGSVCVCGVDQVAVWILQHPRPPCGCLASCPGWQRVLRWRARASDRGVCPLRAGLAGQHDEKHPSPY